MRHADIFLHTAHVEGLPNVLLEAQSAGLPIVAAAAGGVAEAIDPGVTGVVVHSREPRVLAEEVARRLSNREWYDRARRAGPLYVEQRFSVDRMIDATLAVYDGKTRQAMNG
jgi:glycosyltransferase involved in cell wall biosynthesis